jgi:hypothetical protein
MSRYLPAIIFVLFFTEYCALNVFAEQQKPGEYQIKATYLYNFINFIDWPPESHFSSNPSINLCIFGDDPFGNDIDDIRNEIVKGKKLKIKSYGSLDKLKSCDILFIPASEKKHFEQILNSIRNSNVLTVSDTEELIRQGAVISFFVEHNKVRFAVNIKAARRSGLKISAKLLKLAKIINVLE